MRRFRGANVLLALGALGAVILAGCGGAETGLPPGDRTARPVGRAARSASELRRELARLRLREEADRREKEALRGRIQALKSGHPGAKEMDRMFRQIETLNGQIRSLQEVIADLRRSISRPAATGGEPGAAALEIEARSLRQENERLRRRLEHRDYIIASLIRAGVPVERITSGEAAPAPAARIEAKVIAVRPPIGRVMLSAGREQGVKVGYVFSVWRDERFIARVKVLKLFEMMSSARILETSSDEEIREGDVARTRL